MGIAAIFWIFNAFYIKYPIMLFSCHTTFKRRVQAKISFSYVKEELNLCILVKLSFKSDMYCLRYQRKKLLHLGPNLRLVGVILLGSFLISDPHIDKECFVSFVFSVCCVDLEINRNRTSPCGM